LKHLSKFFSAFLINQNQKMTDYFYFPEALLFSDHFSLLEKRDYNSLGD